MQLGLVRDVSDRKVTGAFGFGNRRFRFAPAQRHQ
jgi:hypothetical protein